MSPWVPNLVPAVLQRPPFESVRLIPLGDLTCRFTFLVAITSIGCLFWAGSPFLQRDFFVLHNDKVVLRARPFHLSEDIVLPSFCPSSNHTMEMSLQSPFYILSSGSWERPDSFLHYCQLNQITYEHYMDVQKCIGQGIYEIVKPELWLQSHWNVVPWSGGSDSRKKFHKLTWTDAVLHTVMVQNAS